MIMTNIQLGKLDQTIYVVDNITGEILKVAESDTEHLSSNLLGLATGNNDHLIRLEGAPLNYLVSLEQSIREIKNVAFSDFDLTIEMGTTSTEKKEN